MFLLPRLCSLSTRQFQSALATARPLAHRRLLAVVPGTYTFSSFCTFEKEPRFRRRQREKETRRSARKAQTDARMAEISEAPAGDAKKCMNGDFAMDKKDKLPEFIAHREAIWQRLKAEHQAEVAAKGRAPIKVTLPDGKIVEGQSWETSPFQIAQGISQSLADAVVIAKVNGEVWDLDRPFESDASLQLLKFDDADGQQVFWHSSAHILGEAMEKLYSGHLCYGPPIQEGFYYDIWMTEAGRTVHQDDWTALDTLVKQIIKEKQPFQRLVMTKEDLLEMFNYNEFKRRIITQKVTTPTTTVYKCGTLIDLCRGPHIRHTGKVKSFGVTKNSATYWEGKADAESLQRVYGISFPDAKMFKQWKTIQEEAAKRDHRKIGTAQELFFFSEISPGSCFFMPKGTHIYNTLCEYMKEMYWERGFQNVITPNVFNIKLWQTSGHYEHYAENLFQFELAHEKFAMKPMNCPGHCLMYSHRPRSWKELPIRYAEFGVLHRNEAHGALHGLTRVRRFVQDDAHIFCTHGQIEEEIAGCLDFLSQVYTTFGFEYQLNLSTRPEKYLGAISVWDAAEKSLENALNKFGHEWKLNPADGAFYGPKIDITVTDALRRPFQCATIQLDFQQPERFDLEYVSGDQDDRKRPVIIHRAVLGSLERIIALLCETFAGKWPFWLSPRQALVIPIVSKYNDYATKVAKEIHAAGYCVEAQLDDSETLNKKVRNAQLAQYNFILVVGEKEESGGTVNVRTRDNKVRGEVTLEQLLERFTEFKLSRCLDAEEKF